MHTRIGLSPCCGCEIRQVEPVNCHMECEAYLNWKAKYDDLKARYREERQMEGVLNSYTREKGRRLAKQARRGK